MTGARWQQIKILFEAAVQRPPSERAAFLAAATGGDEALCREIQSLLDSGSPEMAFTERLPLVKPSALPDGAESLASDAAARTETQVAATTVGPTA